MSNMFSFEMTVTGEARDNLAERLKEGVRSQEWGAILDVGDGHAVVGMDDLLSDKMSINDDAIVVRGESYGSPLGLVHSLSEEYPHLQFAVNCNDLSNDFYSSWRFTAGHGQLRDCVAGGHGENEDEIVYVRDGQQLRDLPEWIPA